MKRTGKLSTSYLQAFGCLVITDEQMKITGISEQALRGTGNSAEDFLGRPIGDFLNKTIGVSGSIGFQKIIRDLLSRKTPRQLVNRKTGKKEFYYKFSTDGQRVYIEWEEQHKKHITASRMDELAFLFDQTYPTSWGLVCHALNRLLSFDRICLLQVMDTGHSKVIAEYCTPKAESFKNKEFHKDFMTPEIMKYYGDQSYRYSPNLNTQLQSFFSLEDVPDTRLSQLAPLPKLHESYLLSIGVKSVVFFPLYQNGEFWGMVLAHCSKPKKVDLQIRKLCSFIVQNAMSKYESQIRKGLLDYNIQIKQIEEQVKKELLQKQTVNCALVEIMDVLRLMTRSDGVGIYHEGDVYFHGHCPSKEQFYEIVEYLQTLTDKQIYKDYNFKLSHGQHFKKELPFAGLLSYAVPQESDHILVWFRKEAPTTVTHINHVADGVRIWEEKVRESALPWDESDLIFIDSLQRLINESLLHKMKEKQVLTEELQSMNNELELFTFSLSHDLRNPLSILGMGLQFLQGSDENMTSEKRKEWYQNLLHSIHSIEDIINNIVTLSQTKMAAMSKDPIPMAYTIRKLAREMTLLHKREDCVFHFGQLYPVWGEKSALYQIFLNLLGNAVKYSAPNRKPEIWINSFKEEHRVLYQIKDNGIGIPASTLPHVFEMFSRAENALGQQGTGVGLSLVKRIVDRLGGKIEIRSEVDKGTEVSLSFPLAGDFPNSMLTDHHDKITNPSSAAN